MPVRKYELMVILDPARSEEQQQETLKQISDVVTKYGGTPDRTEVMGKRRLAFPVKKRRDGLYALVYFDTETQNQVLAEIERHCRYSEDILRHLCVDAIVGKSKGDPTRYQVEERPRPMGGYGRGRGDRRPPREYQAPAAAPAEGVAAPAPEAPAAPAEPTA